MKDINIDENKKIEIAEVLSPRLGFRDSAKDFFHMINQLPADTVEIDFTDVKFMSRSFAHEYIQEKKKSRKIILESNVSENVYAMFQAVKKSIRDPHKLKIKPSKTITLPSQYKASSVQRPDKNDLRNIAGQWNASINVKITKPHKYTKGPVK